VGDKKKNRSTLTVLFLFVFFFFCYVPPLFLVPSFVLYRNRSVLYSSFNNNKS